MQYIPLNALKKLQITISQFTLGNMKMFGLSRTSTSIRSFMEELSHLSTFYDCICMNDIDIAESLFKVKNKLSVTVYVA